LIRAVIQSAIRAAKIEGKCGRKLLQPLIAQELNRAGFDADTEDKRGLLGAGLPVWRDKYNEQVEITRGRRKIDIVVYRDARSIALIETESDLDDLRQAGVTRRSGHCDVFSIAKSASGAYFHSYKSLERMAAAAFYLSVRTCSALAAVDLFTNIKSDDAADHNPTGIGLYLVSGACRRMDERILTLRLRSLNAELICCSLRT
jgi:hypothetical protein